EKLRSKGNHSSKAAAIAALDTRKSKHVPPPRAELFEQWQKTNAEFGFTEDRARALLGKVKTDAKSPNLTKEIAAAIHELLESESHFSEQRAIRQTAIQTMSRGISAKDIVDQVR